MAPNFSKRFHLSISLYDIVVCDIPNLQLPKSLLQEGSAATIKSENCCIAEKKKVCFTFKINIEVGSL